MDHYPKPPRNSGWIALGCIGTGLSFIWLFATLVALIAKVDINILYPIGALFLSIGILVFSFKD
jgi:hypothetical protein